LNGIEDVISRPDLGDRAIFLTLSPIGEAQRRPEADLWREFEIARPRILGALLDAVVHGLRAQGRVQLDRLPRMADFALWASACETALWPPRHVRLRLHGKPQSRHREYHRSGPRRQRLRALMVERTKRTGSASDLRRVRMRSRADQHGPKIRGRSPVDCGARRRSCAPWASRSRSLAKAGQGQE
jgi:hypothetical protein